MRPAPMEGSRRLSQAISEGDGISVLVPVGDLEAAHAAEEQGADGIVVVVAVSGLRETTGLPILWRADESPDRARAAGADACLLVAERSGDDGEHLARLHEHALSLGLECVVDVRDEEEVELALKHADPEIFLLSPTDAADEEEELERVLDLLPEVPAGKLAIGRVAARSREDVLALERAGVDAVIVGTGDVADLVGGAPPEV
jgi:indole-3-glycerol phosphate synthase